MASRFGPAELLGLDELFVDVGAEVEGRAAVCAAGLHARAAALGAIPAGPTEAAYVGHVHRAGQRVEADSRHRVQDLRAVPCTPSPAGDAVPENEESGTGWQARLAAGSRLALEIRAAIKVGRLENDVNSGFLFDAVDDLTGPVRSVPARAS